jgi:hypothetical protein
MSDAEQTTPPAPLGVIRGESSDLYHAQDNVSASRLRVFKRRPGGPALYFKRFIEKSLPHEESDALTEGSALHTLVLEPNKFDAEYAILPEDAPDRPTKQMLKAKKPSPESQARIDWWRSFAEQTKGKTILDAGVVARLRGMAGMVHAHSAAAQLLSQGEPEVSWRTRAGGLKHLPPLQCRTDWINLTGCELSKGRPYVVDIKSTATLDVDAFGNFHHSVEEHAYHVQAALYMAILTALGVTCYDFFFVAVEKCAPFGVEVYKMPDRELEEGQRMCEKLLIDLDRCYARHEWPNTSPVVKDLKLPARYWARRDQEDVA